MKQANTTQGTVLTQRPRLGLIIACLMACAGVQAQSSQTYSRMTSTSGGPPLPVAVEIFTNASIAFTGLSSGTKVYQLDGLLQLEAELSQGLPGNEAEAMRIAQDRLRRMAPQLQQRAANTSEGLTQAARYGIDRLPAIVINGESVIYGITDVPSAIQMYRTSAKGQ